MNTMPANWIEDCDYVYNVCQHETGGRPSRYILGQDDNGDLFVPMNWGHPDELYKPFNQWVPLHWLAYLNSRLRKEMATLEQVPST